MTCAHAAAGGHLEVLQWARENGCPWDWKTCAWAAEGGHLAVLRAVSKGMRDAVDATGRKVEEFKEDDAVERGYLSTLKCLRRRGVLKNERLLCAAAARKGDLEALKALRAESFPWDALTCSYAARGGHFEVLKWARENDCPWHKGFRV